MRKIYANTGVIKLFKDNKIEGILNTNNKTIIYNIGTNQYLYFETVVTDNKTEKLLEENKIEKIDISLPYFYMESEKHDLKVEPKLYLNPKVIYKEERFENFCKGNFIMIIKLTGNDGDNIKAIDFILNNEAKKDLQKEEIRNRVRYNKDIFNAIKKNNNKIFKKMSEELHMY